MKQPRLICSLSLLSFFGCSSHESAREPSSIQMGPNQPYLSNRLQTPYQGARRNIHGIDPRFQTRNQEAQTPSCPDLARIVIDEGQRISVADLLNRVQFYRSQQLHIPTFSQSLGSDRAILKRWLIKGSEIDDNLLIAMEESSAFSMAVQYLGISKLPDSDAQPRGHVDYVGGAHMAAIVVSLIATSKYPGCADVILKKGTAMFTAKDYGKNGPEYANRLKGIATLLTSIQAEEKSGHFEDRRGEIVQNWEGLDEQIQEKEEALDEALQDSSENMRFVELDIDATFKIFKHDLGRIQYCNEKVFRGAFSTVPHKALGPAFASLLDRCNQSLDRDMRSLKESIDEIQLSETHRQPNSLLNQKEKKIARLQKKLDDLKAYKYALNNERDSLLTTLETLDQLVQKKNDMKSKEVYREERRELAKVRDQRRKLADSFILYNLRPENIEGDQNRLRREDDSAFGPKRRL